MSARPMMVIDKGWPTKKVVVEYATEDEVLEFANKVRQAGGANILKALLPSEPNVPSQCLIANALNFSCHVSTGAASLGLPSGSFQWYMELPENIGSEKAKAIADYVGCELKTIDRGKLVFRILLPEHIGNAAHAFDKGVGWTCKYNNLIVIY